MAEYLFKITSVNNPKNKLDEEVQSICKSFDVFTLSDLPLFLESLKNTIKKTNLKYTRCNPVDYGAVQLLNSNDIYIHIGRIDQKVLTAYVYEVKGAMP